MADINVLFVCKGNSCRSVMCEAFARARFPNSKFLSAGIEPAGAVKPLAVAVMAEKGIDISNHKPRHMTLDVTAKHIPLDYVVTLCMGACERCPEFQDVEQYKSTRKVHFAITSPAALSSRFETDEERLAVFRAVRDEIESFVAALPETLPTLQCP